MKRITRKRLLEFLDKIAYKGPSRILDDDGEVYYSKIDGSYITRVGMEEHVKFLLKKGITEHLQSAYDEPSSTLSLGFNPKENKWYGWSHRAIFGFTIGSECKPGHCHFKSSNKEEFIKESVKFWCDEDSKFLSATEIESDGELGVKISYIHSDKIPNEKMRGTVGSHFSRYPKKWGKGEWTAKTMEDAKEMAKDFAKGVS